MHVISGLHPGAQIIRNLSPFLVSALIWVGFLSSDQVAAVKFGSSELLTSAKTTLFFPSSTSQGPSYTPISPPGHGQTSELGTRPKKMFKFDWLSHGLPLELGDGVSHIKPHRLQVGRGWFSEKIRVLLVKKGRIDVGLDSYLPTYYWSSESHGLGISLLKTQ